MMEPISVLLRLAAVSLLSFGTVLAEEAPPPCDCPCPSIEEQVERRLSEYKKKLDAEMEDLRDKLNSQLNKEQFDELQKKLQKLFDDMLRDFSEDKPPKPKETVI